MINLSVILINKNRNMCLRKCIEQINSQLGIEDQLIIVDDNSTDNSVEIIESLDGDFIFLKFDSSGNRGATRNFGAKFANNEILVFIDSDIIIGPDNLNIVRQLHEEEKIVGVNGNVFGNGHNVAQFEFLTHMTLNSFVANLLNDFNFLYNYEQFFDCRYNNDLWTGDIKGNWTNYFTSFATVKKEIFDEMGGFDEQFIGWGGEDIEFAYRLNQYGNILFDNRILSFHYTHEKKKYLNTLSNIENTYYILNKYKSFDIEIFVAFTTVNKKIVKKELRGLYDYIIVNNTQKKLQLLKNKELAILFNDLSHKNGYIKYILNDKKEELELFGFALPFSNLSFENIYIMDEYLLVPESLICIVFQESLRISKNVFIKKTDRNYERYKNLSDIMLTNPFYNNVCYISQQIDDFEIIDYNEAFFKIQWIKHAEVNINKRVTCL